MLTDRSDDCRLRAQMQHDRDEKTHARVLVLTVQVYLGATEAIAAGVGRARAAARRGRLRPGDR